MLINKTEKKAQTSKNFPFLSLPSKRGQTHQVFFYIMVIIVVGAVILIGYSSIAEMLNKQCEIAKITLEDDLEEQIAENRNYGFSSDKELKAPCNAEKICFLNETTTNNQQEVMENKIIATAAKEKTGDNIFLISGDKTEPLLQAQKIRVNSEDASNGLLCIESKNNRFPIKLESIGYGYVKISSS